MVTNVSTKLDSNQTENTEIEQDSTIDIINKAKAENTQKQSLKLTGKPVLLVSIQTKSKKQIRCCELSPNGELVVYSTASDVRMLKLEAVSFLHFIILLAGKERVKVNSSIVITNCVKYTASNKFSHIINANVSLYIT